VGVAAEINFRRLRTSRICMSSPNFLAFMVSEISALYSFRDLSVLSFRDHSGSHGETDKRTLQTGGQTDMARQTDGQTDKTG